jgi:hypothetical protein
MKIQDILRTVADMMDPGEASLQQEHPPTTIATVVPLQIDQSDTETPDTMVSPLQQELELMKKAAGVASAFDSEEGYCDACDRPADQCACASEPDSDMDALRHMAGIKIIR